MFIYEKKLQYPVKIATPNPKLASVIISQYGGPDGELGASLRYLSQRFSMPYPELKGLLTDIGTEGSKSDAPLWGIPHIFAGALDCSSTNTHFCGRRFIRTSTLLSLKTAM